MKKRSRTHRSPQPLIIVGSVKRHPDGFGFLIPDDSQIVDVYIPRHEMDGIMANDRIEVKAIPEAGGPRLRGQVLKLVERFAKKVSGIYEDIKNNKGIIRDHSFAWGSDLWVKNPNRLKVKNGDWVSVTIESYPDSALGFGGNLSAVIGDPAKPINDSMRVLHSHNIPHEFSQSTLKEVHQFADHVTDHDRKGRHDLTQLSFITIDGKTAKDFDDAIYVESHPQGFKLWVAIADVSHYVKPNTSLDKEAYERGTSTYFPNFVSPMLPQKLSDELCSLKPQVDRLALVAEMELSFQGELIQTNFYEAVINSKARVTYGEAQEVLDGFTPETLRTVVPVIKKARDLAKILMAKRFRQGSLNLELPEIEIEVDNSGQPIDILQSERLFSHKLIEELMLIANVAVAQKFSQNKVPALYRIHDSPDPKAIKTLESYLKLLGSKKKFNTGSALQKQLTQALQDFSGHPQEHILNILTLRSMAQACYSQHNLGHFGLGFSDYVHFTSPIRRFPDLIIHRQLKGLLGIKDYGLRSEEDLSGCGAFLSACEQRSVKAERQIHSIKKARFMAQFIGQSFPGLITSATKFGVFVVLRQFEVDGLIKLENLPGDRYEFDEKNIVLVGKKSGHVLRIGDPITVIVAAANPDEGRIDFIPDKEEFSAHLQQTQTKPLKKRGKTQSHTKHLRSTRFPPSRRKGKAR
ncbi:MAG: ribonuclease R [Bdellovibrionales bacterium]|nr:ribonuclease R [Bdellovibrionales bacterium]